MKKIWKFFIMFLIANLIKQSTGKAQVNYEHTFITPTFQNLGFQELFLTNLGNDNYKYAIYSYGYSGTSSLSLYNLDYTPYMLNIQIPISSDSVNNAFYRIGYITSTLFDCDSTNIEFAMMLSVPNPNVSPNFCVFRTDGTVIFSKDTVGTIYCAGCGAGSWNMYPIMNTTAGAKLFLFNYDYAASTLHTFVYALCGTLPESIIEINQSDSYVKVFPNPASGQITIQISVPSHSEKSELKIFNSAFQLIKTIEISESTTQLNLDNSLLNSGTYFYSLVSTNKVLQTSKFIISK